MVAAVSFGTEKRQSFAEADLTQVALERQWWVWKIEWAQRIWVCLEWEFEWWELL